MSCFLCFGLVFFSQKNISLYHQYAMELICSEKIQGKKEGKANPQSLILLNLNYSPVSVMSVISS